MMLRKTQSNDCNLMCFRASRYTTYVVLCALFSLCLMISAFYIDHNSSSRTHRRLPEKGSKVESLKGKINWRGQDIGRIMSRPDLVEQVRKAAMQGEIKYRPDEKEDVKGSPIVIFDVCDSRCDERTDSDDYSDNDSITSSRAGFASAHHEPISEQDEPRCSSGSNGDRTEVPVHVPPQGCGGPCFNYIGYALSTAGIVVAGFGIVDVIQAQWSRDQLFADFSSMQFISIGLTIFLLGLALNYGLTSQSLHENQPVLHTLGWIFILGAGSCGFLLASLGTDADVERTFELGIGMSICLLGAFIMYLVAFLPEKLNGSISKVELAVGAVSITAVYGCGVALFTRVHFGSLADQLDTAPLGGGMLISATCLLLYVLYLLGVKGGDYRELRGNGNAYMSAGAAAITAVIILLSSIPCAAELIKLDLNNGSKYREFLLPGGGSLIFIMLLFGMYGRCGVVNAKRVGKLNGWGWTTSLCLGVSSALTFGTIMIIKGQDWELYRTGGACDDPVFMYVAIACAGVAMVSLLAGIFARFACGSRANFQVGHDL